MSEEQTLEEVRAELEKVKKENLERELALEKTKRDEAENLKKQEAEEKLRAEIREEEKAKLLETMADSVTTVKKKGDKQKELGPEILTMDKKQEPKEVVELANHLLLHDLSTKDKGDIKPSGLKYEHLAKAVKTKAILNGRGI